MTPVFLFIWTNIQYLVLQPFFVQFSLQSLIIFVLLLCTLFRVSPSFLYQSNQNCMQYSKYDLTCIQWIICTSCNKSICSSDEQNWINRTILFRLIDWLITNYYQFLWIQTLKQFAGFCGFSTIAPFTQSTIGVSYIAGSLISYSKVSICFVIWWIALICCLNCFLVRH